MLTSGGYKEKLFLRRAVRPKNEADLITVCREEKVKGAGSREDKY